MKWVLCSKVTLILPYLLFNVHHCAPTSVVYAKIVCIRAASGRVVILLRVAYSKGDVLGSRISSVTRPVISLRVAYSRGESRYLLLAGGLSSFLCPGLILQGLVDPPNKRSCCL